MIRPGGQKDHSTDDIKGLGIDTKEEHWDHEGDPGKKSDLDELPELLKIERGAREETNNSKTLLPASNYGSEQMELAQQPNHNLLTLQFPRHSRPRGIFDSQVNGCINIILQALAAVSPHQLEFELGANVGNEYKLTPALRREPMTSSHGQYARVIKLGTSQLNLVWEFIDLLKKIRTQSDDAVNPFALQCSLTELIYKKNRRYRYKEGDSYDAAQFYLDLIRLLVSKSGHDKDIIRARFRHEMCAVKNSPEQGYILKLSPPQNPSTATESPRSNNPKPIPVAEPLLTSELEQYTAKFKKIPDFLMLQFFQQRATAGKSSRSTRRLHIALTLAKMNTLWICPSL